MLTRSGSAVIVSVWKDWRRMVLSLWFSTCQNSLQNISFPLAFNFLNLQCFLLLTPTLLTTHVSLSLTPPFLFSNPNLTISILLLTPTLPTAHIFLSLTLPFPNPYFCDTHTDN